MGLLDNNNVAITTKNGGWSASSTIALDDTNNLLNIADIKDKRNKWVCVKLSFSGITKDSRFKIRIKDEAGIFYSEDGRIYKSICYGREVWDITREYFKIVLYVPLSNVRADGFILRNDYASTAGSTVTVSYAIIDPVVLEKPVQYIGHVVISPTGTGTFAETFTMTAISEGSVDLRWFKYFYVKCVPVKTNGSVESGENYDLAIYRSVFTELTTAANSQMEILREDRGGAFVSDFLPMNSDRGLRAEVTVNTHISDTRFIVEFFGVR